jgi:hypothetical protein
VKVKGTHKSWWECDTGIAYLVSGLEGWRVRRMTQVYDLSDPAHPKFIRNFGLAGQQPGSRGEAPEELHGMISTGPERNRIYFGYGNAGVRALDIRDPYHPKEVAYYIPATTDKTDKRCLGKGDQERCKVAIQTNNVDVDDRGYIYIVDRADTGLHILQLTGEARKVANF